MLRVAVDVMGADKGVAPIVLGALEALKKREFEAILVGDESQISPLISNLVLVCATALIIFVWKMERQRH